ncbi:MULTISPECIES: DUF2087 domain-containing protein [unclassified Clostridium]|uniref:DUF2087 domain-containing protein n=1 Tax=unclassified Clostridium TaxID=2614128 RepID=UPI0025C214ED|nr:MULTISPECIES: DUF2087 domain-containing protein [unclassified Clostridium]
MGNIERFLDDKGRIKIWPAKKELKVEILSYLVSKFEYNYSYTEKEVNSIINEWHTFEDYFLLRRGLIDYKLLSREKDGSKYWRKGEYIDE